MKKIFYAASLSYPAPHASQIQALSTAEAIAERIGDDFVFGVGAMGPTELYTHRWYGFGRHSGPVLAWKQMRYIRREGMKIIYSREPPLMFYLMLLNRFVFRLPLGFIFEAHGINPRENRHTRFGYVIRHSDHVFCLTALLLADLKRSYGFRSASVVPDGVDLRLFAETGDGGEPALAPYDLPKNTPLVTYIGSVGRYDWKGVDVFLAAREAARDLEAVFVVAGITDNAHTWYERYPKGFVFLPWLSRPQVVELMRRSAVLVLPNKSGNAVSARYTSPMKMFEYMASGTPIVASDLPSVREVLSEENALLVPPDDAEALAAGVRECLSNPAGAAQRAAQARADIKWYSWEARAEAILEGIERVA